MTFETSKQFTENELFTISLGASFFKTVDRDMLKHGPRALVFGMDPKRNPGQHVFFYYHQAIGYLRHYLKVLGVHQIGAELGYDFYSRAVELAEMDEKNKRIIEINPWIKSNHLAAKYATNPLDIEHQLQVSIDALEHMTKNTPHFDIYSQMSFPMKNVLSDFTDTRPERIAKILSVQFQDLDVGKVLDINQVIIQESKDRYGQSN